MKKTLHQFLSETSIPDHLLHKAENFTWDHHSEVDSETADKIHAALGHKMFTTFPLSGHGENADPDVVEHLTNHGYTIKDYAAGIASKQKEVGDGVNVPKQMKMVHEKIGSILEKTSATPEVKKAFMNDPARSATKDKDSLHVCITSTPLGVAGMSTGTAWSSCMNLDGGAYNHKVRNDSKHGTHVAYLVKGDDHGAMNHGEPDKPLARIAIKPHHSDDGDTIFRPEGSIYGAKNTAFQHVVSQWSKEKYPAKTGVYYEKNSSLYDDDGETTYREEGTNDIKRMVEERELPPVISHENFNTALAHIHHLHGVESDEQKQQGLTHDFASDSRNARLDDLASVQNLTPQHVMTLHRIAKKVGAGQVFRTLAVRHGDKFSSSMIADHIAQNGGLTTSMVSSPKLTPEQIETHVHIADYPKLRYSKVTPKLMDKVVDHYLEHGLSHTIQTMSRHLSESQIDRIVDHHTDESKQKRDLNGSPIFEYPHQSILIHDKLSKASYDKIVDSAVKKQEKDPYRVHHENAVLIHSSKHATLDSALKLKPQGFLNKLGGNGHVPEHELIKAKDYFMDQVRKMPQKGEHESNYATQIHGSIGNKLPSRIATHLSKSDYEEMANKKVTINFGDAEHSHKYLDAIHDKAKGFDDEISKHLESKYDDEDYDEDEDDDLQNLKSKMHSHLNHYASQIDNHIDDHVESEDRGILADDHERDLMHKSIDVLDHFDNYQTSNNSSRYDDYEHYTDNFEPLKERMHDLNDPHDEDNW